MSPLSVFEFPLPVGGVDSTPFETTAAVEGSGSSEFRAGLPCVSRLGVSTRDPCGQAQPILRSSFYARRCRAAGPESSLCREGLPSDIRWIYCLISWLYRLFIMSHITTERSLRRQKNEACHNNCSKSVSW